jgi:hypothetical protein
MPSASSGDATGNSIGLVASRASTPKAAARSSVNDAHRCQSGRKSSTAASSMKVANASLSHRPFHHLIVTRSPNHMWASSWATTSATRVSSPWVTVPGSTSRSASRKVMAPRFSIAPAAKSGSATRSHLSPG